MVSLKFTCLLTDTQIIHCLKFVDKGFSVIREMARTSALVHTIYWGPAMAFVGIMGPDELEVICIALAIKQIFRTFAININTLIDIAMKPEI